LEDPRLPVGEGIDSNLLIIIGGAGVAVVIIAVFLRSRSRSPTGPTGAIYEY
jgi:hypothetical protein